MKKYIFVLIFALVSVVCFAEADKHFNKIEFLRELKKQVVEKDNGDVVIPFFENVELVGEISIAGEIKNCDAYRFIPYHVLKYIAEDPTEFLSNKGDISELRKLPEFIDIKGNLYFNQISSHKLKPKVYYDSIKDGIPVLMFFNPCKEKEFLISRTKEREKVSIKEWEALLKKNIIKSIDEIDGHCLGIVYGFNKSTKEFLIRWLPDNRIKKTFFLTLHETEISMIGRFSQFMSFNYKPEDDGKDKKKSKKEKQRTFRR